MKISIIELIYKNGCRQGTHFAGVRYEGFMNYTKNFIVAVLSTAMASGIVSAQDENAASAKQTPIVDEFSLVMRNLMKRAQSDKQSVSPASPIHKLGEKVGEIQALLNRSDSELSNASQLESKSLIPQSEMMQIQELENLQAKIELDEERQLAELLITKAKIASLKKSIKNEKQRLALEKASKGVDAALKLVEGEEK